MSLSAIIDALVQAGATPQMIAAAVRAAEESGPVLSARQARNKRYYENKKAEASESRLNASEQDAKNEPVSPPIKSPPITPIKLPPPSTSLRSDTSARAIFAEQFWPVYPRKTERKAAEAKFIALVKSGVDPMVLVDGARRYAASKPEPKYTKHATTWFSKGCWEDELLPRAGPAKNGRSILAKMATGEYWNTPDEQPDFLHSAPESPVTSDPRTSGFAGPLPQRGRVDGGPLLDLRPESPGRTRAA